MSSYYKDETTDGSKSRWIEDTHEARRTALELRREINGSLLNHPPFDVPDVVDYYNRMVHEYASQIRPKQQMLADLWTEELATVNVPDSGGRVHVGQTDAFGDFGGQDPIFQIDWTDREVSLDTLRKNWQTENQVRYTVEAIDPSNGPVERVQRKTLYLPVWACDRVVDQLNQCLNELGWLPSAEVKEYRAGNDEVLTHG